MKIYVLVESRSEGNDVPPRPTIEVFKSRELLLAFLKDNYDIFEEGNLVVDDEGEWTEDESGVWQELDDSMTDDTDGCEKRLTLQTFDV